MTPHEQLARAEDGLQYELRAAFASEKGRDGQLDHCAILRCIVSISAALSAVRKLEDARCGSPR